LGAGVTSGKVALCISTVIRQVNTVIEIGKNNTLSIIREAEFGVYLDGGEFGGVLLPKADVPAGVTVGDKVDVFLYLDTDDFIVATTRVPLAKVGEFGYLKVAEVNNIGAFLDWGLPKQLLLPYGEQRKPLEVGQKVFVRVYIDNSDRLAASAKIEKFLEPAPEHLKMGQQVSLSVWRRSDLGFLVLVDGQYQALLHNQDLFRTVRVGQTLDGYIKRVLEDGKVDVMLDKPGYGKVDELSRRILEDLEDRGGHSPLGDKSAPEDIYQTFGVSKKAYKMSIGALMKQGLITISPNGIDLK
jgi:predicted RNA-binding protein (virulence factor B family)